MPESETILEADGLRVVFFRRGDRYAHRVEVDDGAQGRTVVLESCEGEEADPWPPSPPFQQLHVEERSNGPVVLLIGMAGRSHWSAAVEVAVDRKSISFDVAVRVQVFPQQLGSEYFDSPVGLAPLAPERGEGQGVRGNTLRIETKCPITLNGRRIEPPLAASSAPTTIAWRYAVTLAVAA